MRGARLLCLLGLVGVLAALNPLPRGSGEGDQGPSTQEFLDRTLTALTSLLEFFQVNFHQLNLDAIIGTRIMEGQLKVLLRRMESHEYNVIPARYVSNISRLAAMATSASDNALPYVALLDPPYFQKLGRILGKGFWELDYPSRDVRPTDTLWQYRPDEAIQEEQSDDCVAELLGTGKTKTPCDISEKCWQRMTRLGYSGYSLSHQIFYFQIAEKAKCLEQERRLVVGHRQAGLGRQADTICANMLTEAALLARAGPPPSKQDLFMEQAALCGMYGYQQFFSSDWLTAILSWQHPSGCYKATTSTHEGHGHRVKREEKLLQDGCLCHRSAVAGGALALYVRFIMEAWLEELAPLPQQSTP